VKREPKIMIQDDTIFLTLDLKGLDLYQRGKAIRKFINSDTKIVEDYADTLIRAIFKRNGINVYGDDKSVLNRAFDTLKQKGKQIELIDFYQNVDLERCEIITTTKTKMTILIEDNRYLQCGVIVKEGERDV
jgi:hypothetical protein